LITNHQKSWICQLIIVTMPINDHHNGNVYTWHGHMPILWYLFFTTFMEFTQQIKIHFPQLYI
jgi:hypothetical protein